MPRKPKEKHFEWEWDKEYKELYEGSTRICPICGGEMKYYDNWYFHCDKCNYGYTRDVAYHDDYGEEISDRYAPDWEDD